MHYILIKQAPSWIQTWKTRKGVPGSRGEVKRGIMGEGEGGKMRLPLNGVCDWCGLELID